MQSYKNTTNIPDALVALVANFVKPGGVEIESISLRNKMSNRIAGNWGKYYVGNKSITLNVPKCINNYKTYRKYRKEWITVNNRAEFLVLVLAHEMRHAWQYQKSDWSPKILTHNWYLEFDAETYEDQMLDKWRSFVTSKLPVAATHS